MQEELTQHFRTETDPEKIQLLQRKFLALRNSEKEIVSKHGTVVLSLVKKK